MVEQTQDPQLNHQVQRIYLGGIDNSRGLTASEVWQRLEAKLTNPGNGITKLQWSDVYCGSRCIQFTVIKDDSDLDPVTLVKSWFNNVMWKGCKLSVDETRPHFLQRLQDERNFKQEQEETLSNNVTNSRFQIATNLTEIQQLSRYWKVRRGYCGEPVRHVDTQSCDVTSWSMFERIRQRHQKQQEKDRLRRIELVKSGTNMTIKEAQKRAYYNRSIRLRFADDVDSTENSISVNNILLQDDGTSSDQSVSNSDDDDDDDTKESSEEANIKHETAKYVWSDDESSSSDSEEMNPVSTNVNSSPHLPVSSGANPSNYVWSDDENVSDSDSSHDLKKRRNYSKPRDLDEFESALDLATVDNVNVNEMTATDDYSQANDYDLTRDVERNLSILAQLFPETSKVPSVPHRMNTASNDRETKLPSLAPPTSSGWGASGQMLRFDPSRPQSTSLLLNDDIVNEVQDRENNVDNAESLSVVDKGSDESCDEEQDIEVQNKADQSTVTTGIYEQKKLEQVFKEAREGAPAILSDQMDASGSFAFKFEVDDKDIQNEAPASNFSFNFGNNETTVSQEKLDERIFTDIVADGAKIVNVESNTSIRPRFRAFEFPNEDMLNEMVHSFYYKINDGERMIADVEGWRNDPSVRDKWLKERLALTQDWKRKRKFALTKQQKRNRKS